MLRVGIDNGHKGAIVALDATGQAVWQTRMPIHKLGAKNHLDLRTVYGMLEQLRDLSAGDLYVVLEYAQVMPAQGAVSGFTTGYGYGAICMALIGLGIPHEIQRPREWQKTIKIKVPPGLKGPARKAAIKVAVMEVVERRIPSLRLIPAGCSVRQDGLADAGGIALAALAARPPMAARSPIQLPTANQPGPRRVPPRRTS